VQRHGNAHVEISNGGHWTNHWPNLRGAARLALDQPWLVLAVSGQLKAKAVEIPKSQIPPADMARRTLLHCWLAPAAKIFDGGCGQSASYARFPTFLRLKLNPSRILTKT